MQQSAFGLVSRIAAKHVTDLVVEAELDEEQSIPIELPAELLELLMVRLDDDILDEPAGYHKVSNICPYTHSRANQGCPSGFDIPLRLFDAIYLFPKIRKPSKPQRNRQS